MKEGEAARINFGRHKGKLISELPMEYLEWGAENLTKAELKKAFDAEITKRTEKLINSDWEIPETKPRRPNRPNLRVPKKKDNTPKDYVEGVETKIEVNYNPLIFGKNKTEKIVNITVDNKGTNVYKDIDGETVHELLSHKPWVLTTKKYNQSTRLKGDQNFKYINHISLDRFKELKQDWHFDKWLARNAEESIMIEHGYTYFKGMTVDQVSLLSVDIEATGVDKDAEDAEVILIECTYRDRAGNYSEKEFDIFNYDNQKDLIADFNEYAREVDPDIVIGHNILSYDIPYIDTHHPLKMSRDDSRVQIDEKPFKITHAGLEYDITNCKISGREIIDTQVLSMKYDSANEFPGYGLKAIEQHLGLVGDDRILWNFEKFPTRDYKTWPEGKWEEFKQYGKYDTASPIQMFDIMAPSFFYLTQSIPKSFQDVINQRTGSQIDAMMIRSYLQIGYSQPKAEKKVPYQGAISMGIGGAYKNVRKFDVASLYPSIMLEKNIYHRKKDPNRHMLQILEYFRDERLVNKAKAANGSKYHDDLQSAQKILINSIYGFLATKALLYNYFEGADQVTARGREILQIAVEWACGFRLIEEVKKIENKGKENEKIHMHWVPGPKISRGLGYDLANVDTDAISITNKIVPTKEEFKIQIAELNSLYNEWIEWEDDGVFENFIVIKAKNYVTQTHVNWTKSKDINPETGKAKVKFKGSSIKDSKKEPILRRFMMDTLNIFLDDDNDDQERVLEGYKVLCRDVIAFNDVNDWTIKKSMSKAILNSNTDDSARPQEKQPMDAINEALDKGIIQTIQEGNKFWIYRAILGKKQDKKKGELQYSRYTKKQYIKLGIEKKEAIEGCEHKPHSFCRECNPGLFYPKMVKNAGYRYPELFEEDQDTDHYLNRSYETLRIIENLVDMEKFYNYSKTTNKKYLEDL